MLFCFKRNCWMAGGVSKCIGATTSQLGGYLQIHQKRRGCKYVAKIITIDFAGPMFSS